MTLLSKEVKMNWHSKNKEYYISKGYRFTSFKDTFMVKIEDLPPHSRSIVKVECDYCSKMVTKEYSAYNTQRKTIKKDSCTECKHKKEKDVLQYKQERGMLKRGDKGYWSLKENRLKHLKEHIEEFGTIDGIGNNKKSKSLYESIIHHKETPRQLAIELGYDINDISLRKTIGYWDDFSNVEKELLKLIEIYGRFPTCTEISGSLKISIEWISRHGGIHKIKDKMGYEDKNDLKDNNNYYNKSSYEMLLANYLIANNVTYLREQFPFENENYKSDFTLIGKNNNEIHIEIWGYPKTARSKRAIDYNKVRKIKENLYEKYNVTLISIVKKKYIDVQNSLHEILNDYLNMELKTVELQKLIPSRLFSDEELFDQVMSYSDDGKTLPLASVLRKKDYGLMNEICKRYNTFGDFVIKFNNTVDRRGNNFWTRVKIYECLEHMLRKYGKLLTGSEIEKLKKDSKINAYSKIMYRISELFNCKMYEFRIQFFNHCVENNIAIPKVEIKFLIKMSINISRTKQAYVDEEHQKLATEILNKLNIATSV